MKKMILCAALLFGFATQAGAQFVLPAPYMPVYPRYYYQYPQYRWLGGSYQYYYPYGTYPYYYSSPPAYWRWYNDRMRRPVMPRVQEDNPQKIPGIPYMPYAKD